MTVMSIRLAFVRRLGRICNGENTHFPDSIDATHLRRLLLGITPLYAVP